MNEAHTTHVPALRPPLVAGVVVFWLLVGLFTSFQGVITTRLGGARLFSFEGPLIASAVWVPLTLGRVSSLLRSMCRAGG